MAAVGLPHQAKGLKTIASKSVPSYFTNHLITMKTVNGLLGRVFFTFFIFIELQLRQQKGLSMLLMTSLEDTFKLIMSR